VIDYPLLRAEAARHPYPLLFATISGAHLYGFPSPDSDYDLRGVHILPAKEAVGLLPKRDTIEVSGLRDGVEMDLVTHDVLKFFNMLLKRNGYVLEQLYSPLIVHTTAEHEELKEIAAACVTRHHSHHYLGFAATQWNLLQKEDPPRVKPLLYVYRVILTGIHLMRTGSVEANLLRLNDEFRLPYIPELVARKMSGPEKGPLAPAELEFHGTEYARLLAQLETEHAASALPETPTCREALNDLLVRIRLGI
jgi:predicted nucleotidyltransferase